MKVAITCENRAKGAEVSKVFARCGQFAIFDTESDVLEYIENPFRRTKDYAGEEAARFLAEKGVKRIIGYEFGYRARKITDLSLIQLIVLGKDHMMVDEVLQMLKENRQEQNI